MMADLSKPKVRELWNKVRDYFPEDVDINIVGPCIACFPDQQP
jgi:hypothetical protein